MGNKKDREKIYELLRLAKFLREIDSNNKEDDYYRGFNDGIELTIEKLEDIFETILKER